MTAADAISQIDYNNSTITLRVRRLFMNHSKIFITAAAAAMALSSSGQKQVYFEVKAPVVTQFATARSESDGSIIRKNPSANAPKLLKLKAGTGETLKTWSTGPFDETWNASVGEWNKPSECHFLNGPLEEEREGWLKIPYIGYNGEPGWVSSKYCNISFVQPFMPENKPDYMTVFADGSNYEGAYAYIVDDAGKADQPTIYLGRVKNGMLVCPYSYILPAPNSATGKKDISFAIKSSENGKYLNWSRGASESDKTMIAQALQKNPAVVNFMFNEAINAEGAHSYPAESRIFVPDKTIYGNATLSFAYVDYETDKDEVAYKKRVTEGSQDSPAADGEKESAKRETLAFGNQETPAAKDDDPICVNAEQPAEFPGGMDALMKCLSENFRYPAIAIENNVQGKVVVRMVIEKDGSIGECTVVKSVDKDLDNEALRLARSLPKWIPAKYKGQKVRSYFTLPINFHLQ